MISHVHYFAFINIDFISHFVARSPSFVRSFCSSSHSALDLTILSSFVLSANFATSLFTPFFRSEKSECHYTNGMQQVRYLKRLIWGQQEICYYDSDLGFSVACTELGRPIAEYWNRLEWLSYLWASVEKFCSYNYRRFKNITVGRRVKPRVKISTLKAESSHRPSLLVCSATGFYPSEIATKWFKNGQEETAGVVSRELLHNGDWTFQTQVMLETKPKRGDIYTCQVEHVSLQTPITMQWVAQPDSAKSKMFIGIGGFVVGLIFMVLGLLVYQKNKKGEDMHSLLPPQVFIHTLG
uniref:Ig-like domain-containing protein n=1 Tax=Chelonoidis abingdonii TaxID=106734 RepID=A0A8C0QP90_CHEAB